MKIFIYLIWFPTSRKYYVGQTCNLKQRMEEHLRSGSTVCKALYKYDDWKVSILHSCENEDEAKRIEIEEIRNFNSVAPNGYNLTHGGEGAGVGNKNAQGHTMSEDGRKKVSEVIKKRNFGNKYAVGHKSCHPLKKRIRILKDKLRKLEGE
jgi:predicted GIY-YIG superfamily endonuclease